jgi:hypothetical protein
MFRFVLLAVGLVALGCSSSSLPTTYPVSGTVSAPGQNLAGGSIEFVPEGIAGQRAFGEIAADGSFTLSPLVGKTKLPGAVEGTYRATVVTPSGEDQSGGKSLPVTGTFTVKPGEDNKLVITLGPTGGR